MNMLKMMMYRFNLITSLRIAYLLHETGRYNWIDAYRAASRVIKSGSIKEMK
mgnify:CR=1 FL=1